MVGKEKMIGVKRKKKGMPFSKSGKKEVFGACEKGRGEKKDGTRVGVS